MYNKYHMKSGKHHSKATVNLGLNFTLLLYLKERVCGAVSPNIPMNILNIKPVSQLGFITGFTQSTWKEK